MRVAPQQDHARFIRVCIIDTPPLELAVLIPNTWVQIVCPPGCRVVGVLGETKITLPLGGGR